MVTRTDILVIRAAHYQHAGFRVERALTYFLETLPAAQAEPHQRRIKGVIPVLITQEPRYAMRSGAEMIHALLFKDNDLPRPLREQGIRCRKPYNTCSHNDDSLLTHLAYLLLLFR